jgi:hypothetical protein
METLAYIILSLLPGLVLGAYVFRLARKVDAAVQPPQPPAPPTPPEPAIPTRLQNEAALLSLETEQRCAMLLTSLEEPTGWAVYRMLDPLHGEIIAIEIPHLPTLHPSARQQMFDDIAEQLGLPKDSLHQRLAAEPELLARMLTRVLPPTPRQMMDELGPSHSLPDQWGSINTATEVPLGRRPLLSLWDWLAQAHGDWTSDD